MPSGQELLALGAVEPAPGTPNVSYAAPDGTLYREITKRGPDGDEGTGQYEVIGRDPSVYQRGVQQNQQREAERAVKREKAAAQTLASLYTTVSMGGASLDTLYQRVASAHGDTAARSAFAQAGLQAPAAVPGQATGASSAPGQRPWYMNFDDATLQAMIKTRPDLAPTIPNEVKLTWSNEFFLANPQFQDILTPERRATFGAGALQAPTGISYIGGVPGGPPSAPTWPTDGRSAEAGDKTGTITRGGPTGVGLTEGGVTVPLPPGLAAPITGNQTPTYRTQGNVPFYSAQAKARMTPSERELLGVTINRAGGNAIDQEEEERKLFSAPQGGGASYSGQRRY